MKKASGVKILLFVICVSVTVAPFLCGRSIDRDNVPNVIVVTLGGVRRSETIDDRYHQYMPKLWDIMLKKGTLYSNLVNLNLSFHVTCVQAIDTGETYHATGGIEANTIFTLVGEKYGLKANKLWSIGHFNSLNCKYEKDKGRR